MLASTEIYAWDYAWYKPLDSDNASSLIFEDVPC